MEELQISNGKRVYALEPNVILRADFSKKYIHYLLPALVKIGNERTCENKDNEALEKIVQFEVDMALVLSACKFAWSHALKHKLERDIQVKFPLKTAIRPPTFSNLLHIYKHSNTSNMGEMSEKLPQLPPFSRHLVAVGNQSNRNFENTENTKRVYQRPMRKRTRIIGEEDETGCRLKTLRKILPGGDEMNTSELFSQVESYIVCLEQQVSILRTLVNIH